MNVGIRRMLLLVVVMVIAMPGSADAGLLSWLGRLSGPGPFWGLDANICVKTFKLGKARSSGEEGLGAARLSCPEAKLDERHISWYVTGSWALASSNPLDYAGVDISGKSQRVWLLKVGTSLDFTVVPSLDVGIGGGIMHFGGERFDGFSRPYVEPVRLGVRPLLWSRGRDKKRTEHDGWLMVTASWIIHLGTLDGPSFGALFDTYRTYNEHNVSLGVTVDVFRLFK